MAMAWSSSSRVTKSRGTGNFGGFLSHWECIVHHSIWDPYKNCWIDQDAIWDDEWAWPEEQCVTWVTIPEGERTICCGKHVPDKPNNVIIANWTRPCSGTRQGQTLDCKRWTRLLSVAKGVLHTAGEVWYLLLPRLLMLLFKCRLSHSITGGRIAARIVALTPSMKRFLLLKIRWTLAL